MVRVSQESESAEWSEDLASWTDNTNPRFDLFSSDIHQELAARDSMVVLLLWLGVAWMSLRALGLLG